MIIFQIGENPFYKAWLFNANYIKWSVKTVGNSGINPPAVNRWKEQKMETNILMGGMEELGVIKGKVIELNECVEQKKTLEAGETQLEKKISNKEKEISDEIVKVTRQRKTQVEATFDEQINSVNERLKKEESKKSKTKKVAVTQRIDLETTDLRNVDNELNLDGKSIFKQEKIPFLYNNRLFFALYFPRGFGDFVIILLVLALVFFAIPFGVYYLWFAGMNVLYLALFYVAVIVVFGGIYLIIGKTKCKHKESLDKVREMRRKIKNTKRQKRIVMRQIKRDKDESGYGLEEFDSNIESLQRSVSEFLEQKKKALSDFENATSKDIKDQITARYEDELNGLKAEYRTVYEQNKENEDRLNKLSLNISAEYEGYLGKDIRSLEKIAQMEEFLTSGRAKTLSEAIVLLSKK